MEMNARELVAACIDVYKSYRPSVVTIDTHAQEWLDSHNIGEEGDRVFIHEIFYGLIRYKKLIRVVISSFFYNHASEASRLDQDVYMVFCFLAVLRLDELTWGEFLRFVKGFDPLRMVVFLSFLFDPKNIRSWFRDEWVKLYDPEYVDETLIAGLMKYQPQAQELVDRLRAAVSGPAADMPGEAQGTSRSTTKKFSQSAKTHVSDGSMTARERGAWGSRTTKSKPYGLTKPAITKVPEPEAIPAMYKARPVPSTTYEPNRDLNDKISKSRRNFRESRKKEYEGDGFSFLGQGREKAQTARPRRAASESDDGPSTTRSRKPGTIPDYGKAPPVKLTAAAILREDAMFRKKQDEELQLLQKYEKELKDPTEFYRWQEKMRLEDELKKQAELEKRKYELMLSAEEVALAKMRAEDEKKRIAAEMRIEKVKLKNVIEKQKVGHLKSARDKVEMVKRDIRDEARRKKLENIQKNKESAEKAAEERRAFELEKEKREERERKKKAEQIRAVRAMELVPKKVVKRFDPTEPAHSGLLTEMSMTEAKERLQMNKAREESVQEDKRSEIISARQNKDAKIVAKMNAISRYRGAVEREASARARRFEVEKQQIAAREQYKGDQQLVQLQQKLEEKRMARMEERKKLTMEQKRLQIKAQLLEGDSSALEEKKYLQLEKASERVALEKQRKRQMERMVMREAKTRETLSKVQHAAGAQKKQLLKEKEYNEREKQSKIEARDRTLKDKHRIEEIVDNEKRRYRKQLETKGMLEKSNIKKKV